MSDLANIPRTTLTLQEQADFILALHDRTFLGSDGTPARETYVALSREDGDELAALGHRLARMARFEDAIRDLVTGRVE